MSRPSPFPSKPVARPFAGQAATSLLRRLALAALVATACLFAGLTPREALAQVTLISTTPEAEAKLESGPEAMVLRFSQPVTPLGASLRSPNGVSRDLSAAMSVGDGGELRIPLPSDAPQGVQIVNWRVASWEGRPIEGSTAYTIAAPVAEIAPPGAMETGGVKTLSWLARALTYGGLFLGLGGVLFGAILPPLPARARQICLDLITAALIALPVSVALRGLEILGRPLTEILFPEVWRAGLASPTGATALMAAASLALGVLALGMPRWRPHLAGGALTGGALALALSAPAQDAGLRWLTRPMEFLHLGGAALWIGALLPLAFLLTRRTPRAMSALAWLARWLPWLLGPIALSGLILAAAQLGAPSAAWLTPYGGLLLGKLFLLVAAFLLALWIRLGLTAPTLEGSGAARIELRRSLWLQLALMLGVLGLSAGWRFMTPPRVLAAETEIAAARESVEQGGFLSLMGGGVEANR